jgi:O-glycosyl hydrolase
MQRNGAWVLLSLALLVPARLTAGPSQDAIDVFDEDAYLTTPLANPDATRANDRRLDNGPIRQVVIRDRTAETNATQLSILNAATIAKGDVLVAELEVRGKQTNGTPAQVEFYFEQATSPWTKSMVQSIRTAPANAWRTVRLAFSSAADYAPGAAMASLRLAFGPQTVELRRLRLQNFRRTRELSALQSELLERNRLGSHRLVVNPARARQTMLGLGGNFCKPRYGATTVIDAVGERALRDLNVRIVRTGLPLNHFAPTPDQIVTDSGPARASLLALQRLAKLRVPITVSVWEASPWLLPGRPEGMGRALPPNQYGTLADLVTRYLVIARDRYGAHADYFSFNEPDYGVNFKFTAAELANFIAVAGPRFRAAKLKTKFITADTANGTTCAAYARTLLTDRRITEYLGPIGFHSWDAFGASEASYRAIAQVGKQFRRPVWCLEAGHDAQLWQAENPWPQWSNAQRTVQAYLRTLELTEANTMAYWTYENDYAMTSPDGRTAYPIFEAMREMSRVFATGRRVIPFAGLPEGLFALATVPSNVPGSPTTTDILLTNAIGPGQVQLAGLPNRGRAVIVTMTAAGTQRTTATVGPNGLAVPMPTQSVVRVTVTRA